LVFREPWAAAQGSQKEILAQQRLFSYRCIGGSLEQLTGWWRQPEPYVLNG
jgi:hypothetical protein